MNAFFWGYRRAPGRLVPSTERTNYFLSIKQSSNKNLVSKLLTHVKIFHSYIQTPAVYIELILYVCAIYQAFILLPYFIFLARDRPSILQSQCFNSIVFSTIRDGANSNAATKSRTRTIHRTRQNPSRDRFNSSLLLVFFLRRLNFSLHGERLLRFFVTTRDNLCKLPTTLAQSTICHFNLQLVQNCSF